MYAWYYLFFNNRAKVRPRVPGIITVSILYFTFLFMCAVLLSGADFLGLLRYLFASRPHILGRLGNEGSTLIRLSAKDGTFLNPLHPLSGGFRTYPVRSLRDLYLLCARLLRYLYASRPHILGRLGRANKFALRSASAYIRPRNRNGRDWRGQAKGAFAGKNFTVIIILSGILHYIVRHLTL